MEHLINIPTDLIDRQYKLEEAMRRKGIERYFAAVNNAREHGREASTAYGVTILKRGVEPLAEAIKAMMDEANSGKAGRRPLAVRYLDGLTPEVVAFLTLRVILEGITCERLVQGVAVAIGSEIEMEAMLMRLEERDKKRYAVTSQHVTRSSNRNYRRAVFKHAVEESDLDWKAWPKTDRLHLGQKLINLAVEHSGLVEVVSREHATVKGMKVTAYYLSATAGCLEWIEQRNNRMALLSPVYLPTLIQPRPWEGAWGGGYYSPDLPKLTIVKTRSTAYLKDLDNHLQCGGADEVLRALNAMQNTAWRVNTRVLDTLTTLWELRGDESVAGLPARRSAPLPRCPICGADMTNAGRWQKHDCFEKRPDELPAWKKAAATIREYNAKLTSRQLQLRKTIEMAEQFRSEAAFYYPYQLDFRGRVYSVPSHLTPQGTDAAKGLLMFAEGKALGTDGAVNWLAIHGANTWGNDKVPFGERRKWVEDNQHHILASAADPLGYSWWQDADSPFCFLAFCFEWAGYVAEGLDFVSHLPIAMDGTCNGLQIFSLMLRDEEGGRAVNVLPSDKPQDIYGIVAERTVGKLKAKLLTGEVVTSQKDGKPLYDEKAEAKKWLDLGVDRKATKRQVMVVPYGGTRQSCREYTESYLKGRIDGGVKWAGSTFKSALFASGLIWESIEEVVQAAPAAMRFLQGVASIIAGEGLPIVWTTPTGFPVRQAYHETSLHRVETRIGDSVVKLSLTEDHPQLDARKQRTGISPNYVHSLDAAALQRTVCRAVDQDIHSFAMIHDSYGTHAADTPALAHTLREVFVDMFGGKNLLEVFLDETKQLIQDEGKLEKLPALPPLGSLDVNKVMEADFFFA